MDIWISLVAGITIGWVIEWVVDWLYWRRGIEAFYHTEFELRQELNQVKQDYQVALAKIADLSNRLPESQLQASAQTNQAYASTDDLTLINGIGSAAQRKLVGAQITTFAALSNSSPRVLEDIVGDQSADYDKWIEQARDLAMIEASTEAEA